MYFYSPYSIVLVLLPEKYYCQCFHVLQFQLDMLVVVNFVVHLPLEFISPLICFSV